jgi:DNA invertase Pin-like site-specific DNA recombinase
MTFNWLPQELRTKKIALLEADQCEGKIIEDIIKSGEVRKNLNALIDKLQVADVLCIDRLSDVARSMFEINALTTTLKRKGATLRILNGFAGPPLDTSNPSGEHWFDYVKEFHNAVEIGMVERRLKGIDDAKREGVFKGRKPLAPEKVKRIIEQFEAGTIPREIAKLEGISRVSVYRILKRDRAGKETISTPFNNQPSKGVNIMNNTNLNTESPTLATASGETSTSLFTQDNMLDRCRKVKAIIKGLHMDFLRSDHGLVGDELNDVIEDAAFELATLDVAHKLMLNAKPHHIATYVDASMSIDLDGGNDRSDLVAAAKASTIGRPQ